MIQMFHWHLAAFYLIAYFNYSQLHRPKSLPAQPRYQLIGVFALGTNIFSQSQVALAKNEGVKSWLNVQIELKNLGMSYILITSIGPKVFSDAINVVYPKRHIIVHTARNSPYVI